MVGSALFSPDEVKNRSYGQKRVMVSRVQLPTVSLLLSPARSTFRNVPVRISMMALLHSRGLDLIDFFRENLTEDHHVTIFLSFRKVLPKWNRPEFQTIYQIILFSAFHFEASLFNNYIFTCNSTTSTSVVTSVEIEIGSGTPCTCASVMIGYILFTRTSFAVPNSLVVVRLDMSFLKLIVYNVISIIYIYLYILLIWVSRQLCVVYGIYVKVYTTKIPSLLFSLSLPSLRFPPFLPFYLRFAS